MKNVVVIGAGAWGSALAQAASIAGNRVHLVGRDVGVVDEINALHTNSKYLGAQTLERTITAGCDFEELKQADMVILAVPAQATRGVIGGFGDELKRRIPVIVTAKGFEKSTLALQSQIVATQWEGAQVVVLSGPSFAADVAGKKPTAVTMAGENQQVVADVVCCLSSDVLRPYASRDVLGVQLCAGLKNVYALGAGAIEGAGLGLSARSAFMARALYEMGEMVVALGGDRLSSMGLAGVGDLMLSCTSEQSRNYAFGVQLGRGGTVDNILGMGIGLAEGVVTAPVALSLGRQSKTDVPLVASVNALLVQKQSVTQIVQDLMQRRLKAEGK